MKKADEKQFATASPIYEIIWRQVVFPKTNAKFAKNTVFKFIGSLHKVYS